MTLSDLRADIPALERTTYLNWGASGPSPRRVVEAVESALEDHEYRSPEAEGMYDAAADVYEEARTTVAGFVGADESEIALTQSTTDAINRVAAALDWGPEDVVVTTDLEHSAGRLPWARLEEAAGIEVRVVETQHGEFDLDALAEALEGATLLCTSALDWFYGRSHPISEMVDLAHEQGALALVDAVQVVGQRPMDMDVWGADFVAGAGHKWLLGPWGAGFLYVNDEVLDSVEPGLIGYRGVAEADGSDYELAPDASRFEIGTTNPAPYAGLTAAIESTESIGLPTVQDHIETLTDRFKASVPDERLRSPSEYHSGLVTVEVSEPETVVETLDEDGLKIRSLPLPDSVRVSIHAVNTADEVDAAADALQTRWS